MLNSNINQYAAPAQHIFADEQIDIAIYKIDGAMNNYDPANPDLDVPPFTQACLVKMRAVIRDLLPYSQDNAGTTA